MKKAVSPEHEKALYVDSISSVAGSAMRTSLLPHLLKVPPGFCRRAYRPDSYRGRPAVPRVAIFISPLASNGAGLCRLQGH